MIEESPYPERHVLKYRRGVDLKLLVDTNTNDWRFKLLYDGVAVSGATAVFDGDVLVLQSFWMQSVIPTPESFLGGIWRKFTQAVPKPTELQGATLGRLLLRTIIRRARDFVATAIVADTTGGGFGQLPDAPNWLQRQGFNPEVTPDGAPAGRLRLGLVAEVAEGA